MWLIDNGEEISCCSDDCFQTSVVSKSSATTGKGFLEIAPKFRYLVRVSECERDHFQLLAANMLLTHNLLVTPAATEGSKVLSAVVASFNYRITRIFDGEEGAHLCDARTDPIKKTAWGAPAAGRQLRASPEARFTSWRFNQSRPQDAKKEDPAAAPWKVSSEVVGESQSSSS
jgi:hypothetical protein